MLGIACLGRSGGLLRLCPCSTFYYNDDGSGGGGASKKPVAAPLSGSQRRSELASPQPLLVLMWFRVLSPAAVREGVELDSGCRGHIDEGEVVRALDVKSTRVRARPSPAQRAVF